MVKIEDLIDICERYISSGYYVGDKIPESKLSNASMNFPIPPKEKVIAIVDGTILGTCKTGLAICSSGIRWKNDWKQETRNNYLMWNEFTEIKIATSGLYNVQLGNGNFFNTSGASMKKAIIVNLLNDIKELIISDFTEESDGKNEVACEKHDSFTPPPLEQWMIAMDGKQYGPYDILKIKDLVLKGEFKKEKCYVWKKGMDNWKFMNEISEFNRILGDEVPPLPPMV